MNTTVTFESDVDVETRRQTLKNLLESNHVVVEFTKVNGDHRSMPCTLKEGMIPAVTSSESARPANSEIMSVWSTDKNEWRSFRLSNVISAQIHA
jgi:hypothetical protein